MEMEEAQMREMEVGSLIHALHALSAVGKVFTNVSLDDRVQRVATALVDLIAPAKD